MLLLEPVLLETLTGDRTTEWNSRRSINANAQAGPSWELNHGRGPIFTWDRGLLAQRLARGVEPSTPNFSRRKRSCL